MGFKERLKQARKNIGMTQEQLGELIGVAKSTITGYEKGKSEPDMTKTSKIIEVLQIDANYLFQDCLDESSIEFLPISMQSEADEVAEAYEKADVGTQAAVRKLLDIKSAQDAAPRTIALAARGKQPTAEQILAIAEEVARVVATEEPLTADTKGDLF